MESVIDWLMEGDPVIRWQTMRDLSGCSEKEWQAERQRIGQVGWGAQFLASLQSDSTWPTGRWTGTVWTLLTLIDCGFPADHPQVYEAARRFLERHLTPARANDETWLLTRVDLCHLGFWLRIGAYFLGDELRLRHLADTILRAQMSDGGWNCRKRNYPKTCHSSFHTTFNVLEGLAVATEAGIVSGEVFRRSETCALEFILAHRMYRSDRTGEIVDEKFTYLTFPSYWHYTVLRGLDYLRNHSVIEDTRLDDPIALLESRRNSEGHWPVEKRIAGSTLFDMEKMGKDSRWNTLRALRVLRSRQRNITREESVSLAQ